MKLVEERWGIAGRHDNGGGGVDTWTMTATKILSSASKAMMVTVIRVQNQTIIYVKITWITNRGSGTWSSSQT